MSQSQSQAPQVFLSYFCVKPSASVCTPLPVSVSLFLSVYLFIRNMLLLLLLLFGWDLLLGCFSFIMFSVITLNDVPFYPFVYVYAFYIFHYEFLY